MRVGEGGTYRGLVIAVCVELLVVAAVVIACELFR